MKTKTSQQQILQILLTLNVQRFVLNASIKIYNNFSGSKNYADDCVGLQWRITDVNFFVWKYYKKDNIVARHLMQHKFFRYCKYLKLWMMWLLLRPKFKFRLIFFLFNIYEFFLYHFLWQFFKQNIIACLLKKLNNVFILLFLWTE